MASPSDPFSGKLTTIEAALAREEEPTLAVKLAALQDPSTYPGCDAVVAVETHMSWVFLAADSAYKLKKPIRRPHLDFSTLALRRGHCEAEVVLNRRHSTNVYRGVVPLCASSSGRLTLTGGGFPVEWLVAMRRLDRTRALDHMIAARAEPRDRFDDLVRRLAEFYRAADRPNRPSGAYTAQLARRLAALAEDLKDPALALDARRIETVTRLLGAYAATEAAAFERRIRDGGLVEGHGDLRPEHIFFEEHVQIIDCLEFSRELRCLDLVDDLSLLFLECERLGARGFGEDLVRACLEALAIDAPDRLIAYYAAVHALQRALLAILHNAEAEVRDPEKWRTRASTYLDLAEAWSGRL